MHKFSQGLYRVDLARIINSDDVQSMVRQIKKRFNLLSCGLKSSSSKKNLEGSSEEEPSEESQQSPEVKSVC